MILSQKKWMRILVSLALTTIIVFVFLKSFQPSLFFLMKCVPLRCGKGMICPAVMDCSRHIFDYFAFFKLTVFFVLGFFLSLFVVNQLKNLKSIVLFAVIFVILLFTIKHYYSITYSFTQTLKAFQRQNLTCGGFMGASCPFGFVCRYGKGSLGTCQLFIFSLFK